MKITCPFMTLSMLINLHASDIQPCPKSDQAVGSTRLTAEQSTFPLLWYPNCHRLDIQLCIMVDTDEKSKGKRTLCLLMHWKGSDSLKEAKELHGDSMEIPPLKQILGCFPVVTIQVPCNASFQVQIPQCSAPGQLGNLLAHLAEPRSLNLLCGTLPGPHSLRGSKVAQQFEGFFALKEIWVTQRVKRIPGNIWEYFVHKALSEQHAKHSTGRACTWPSCNIYYYWLLLNKPREGLLEGSHTFSACSWRS